jgi:YHS domain-containing protein
MATKTDPVCGMQVDERKAYYFCSTSCKQKFDQNPQQYVRTTAQSARGGTNR